MLKYQVQKSIKSFKHVQPEMRMYLNPPHPHWVEKGRHLDLHRNDRTCPFCPNMIEDEKHFLITCGIYKYLRTHLYTEAKNVYPFICNQPYDVRFIQLMSDSLTVPVSRFVFRAMELREFLSKKPRRCEWTVLFLYYTSILEVN